MTRRHFLKAILGVTAAALIPVSLMKPETQYYYRVYRTTTDGYVLIGTTTGRFSGSEPNAQSFPRIEWQST